MEGHNKLQHTCNAISPFSPYLIAVAQYYFMLDTVADMFSNPIAQESEYRLYVVHHLPSVQLLDRHGMYIAAVQNQKAVSTYL